MESEKLVREWFKCWESGNYKDIPVSDDFTHTSPYGTIEGKAEYLHIVESNKEKILGNRIVLHDSLMDTDRACVRYTIYNPKFSMEVSEWIYLENALISNIVSYYNIDGDIPADRKLQDA